MLLKVIITFGSRFLAAALNFFIVVMLSKVLGPEGKGTCSLALSVIAVFLIFNNVAGGATLVYLVPRFTLNRILPACYGWLVVTVLLLFGILRLYPLVNAVYHADVLLLSVVHGLVSINLNVLLGRERSGVYNLLSVLQVVITFITLVIQFYVLKNNDVHAYLSALYAGYISTAILSFVFLLKLPPPGIKADAERPVTTMFRLGFINLLANSAQFLNYRIAFYFLDNYHGAGSVGIYSNGVSIAEAIWLLGNSISVIQYARIANTAEKAEAAALTARLARINGLVTLVMVIPFIFFTGAFYAWMFGPEFSGVASVIRLLLPGILAFSFNIICSNYFSGTGKYAVNTWASVAGLFLTIILCSALIPAYGIGGASLAAAISYICTTAITVTWFLKESGLTFKDIVPRASDVRTFFAGLRTPR
jgi:O-antigen/teichoic acid export membrane protein